MTIYDAETLQDMAKKVRASTLLQEFERLAALPENATAQPIEILAETLEELNRRQRSRKLDLALHNSGMPMLDATIADLVNPEGRNLDIAHIARIAGLDFHRMGNLTVQLIAPAGVGKTYVACAIGHQACVNGFSVAYVHYYELESAMASGPAARDGLLDWIASADVFILDDFVTTNVTSAGLEAIKRIVDVQHFGCRIIVSQTDVPGWQELFKSFRTGESVVNQLAWGERINMSSFDMRQWMWTNVTSKQL